MSEIRNWNITRHSYNIQSPAYTFCFNLWINGVTRNNFGIIFFFYSKTSFNIRVYKRGLTQFTRKCNDWPSSTLHDTFVCCKNRIAIFEVCNIPTSSVTPVMLHHPFDLHLHLIFSWLIQIQVTLKSSQLFCFLKLVILLIIITISMLNLL